MNPSASVFHIAQHRPIEQVAVVDEREHLRELRLRRREPLRVDVDLAARVKVANDHRQLAPADLVEHRHQLWRHVLSDIVYAGLMLTSRSSACLASLVLPSAM
jgi:hypothetical protein